MTRAGIVVMLEMPRLLVTGLLLVGPLLSGAGAGTERPKPVDVSAAFRSVEVPDEARLSGSMFLAVKAAVDFRSIHQKSRLRPTELVVENFVFKVEKADCAQGGAGADKDSCLEVSLRARLSEGEEVLLDSSARRLGRFAAYLVRERDHAVIREALGNQPARTVP